MAQQRVRFYSNEQIVSQDAENQATYGFSNIADVFNNFVYNGNTIILSGGTVSQQPTASGQVNVAPMIANQNGYPVEITTQQVCNILSGSPGSGVWGTGQSSGSLPRIDIVVCQYTTQDGTPLTRNVMSNGSPVAETLNTVQTGYYALNVVHGTAASSPSAPSVPSGWFLLATISVPANATTIVTADITDNTGTLKNSGGWLKNVSAGRMWVNDSTTSPEVDTASGILFKFGTSGAQASDNTAAGYLDLTGGTNGLRAMSPFLFNAGATLPSGQTLTLSGTGIPLVIPSQSSQPGSPTNGALAVVNNQWYQYNGTAWVAMAASLPSDVAYYDKTQTWSALQTFGNDISFGGAQLSATALATDQILRYNGANWVNTTDVKSFNGRVGAVSPTSGDYSFSMIGGTVANNQLAGPVVNSFNGRSGTVSPASGDYSFSEISGTASNSQLAGPVVSGVTAGTGITVSAAPSGVGTQQVSVTNPFSSGQQTFTSTGTFTPASGVSRVYVQAWGGGGGGGGGSTANSVGSGGGGGSGGFVCGWLSCSPGVGVTVTIGGGGSGGAAGSSGQSGGTGGNTTIGSFTAYGGSGGVGGTTSAGAGGNGGGYGGPAGFLGETNGGGTGSGGTGGSGASGPAGGGSGGSGGAQGPHNGNPGSAPGGGGGGGGGDNVGAGAGAMGGAGQVIITW